MKIVITALLIVTALSLFDDAPIEYCDRDFCYKNGRLVDEDGNYLPMYEDK